MISEQLNTALQKLFAAGPLPLFAPGLSYHGGSDCYAVKWSSQSYCPEEWPGGYGVFNTNCPGNPDPPHGGLVVEPFYKH
jgi:hypothetical protein